jgi:molecular chaperone IbpA
MTTNFKYNTTNLPSIFDDLGLTPAFKDMNRFTIGVENQFNRLNKIADMVKSPMANFPPYNIIRTSETTYSIEMAVAGFDPSEIDIEVNDGRLIVSSKVKEEGDQEKTESIDYLFRGIAKRSFTRTFVLDEHVEVREASFMNGMLTIHLEYVVPEHMKPRKVEIKRVEGPQLLEG